MQYKSLALLASVYLLTVTIGLHVGATFIPLMYPPAGEEPLIQPVVDDPDSIASSLKIFGYVLIMTAALLLLMKYGLGKIIKLFLGLAFFMGMMMAFVSFIGDYGIILAILLLFLMYYKKDNLFITNITLTFTIAGIGGWFGASLSTFPTAFVLIVVLAVYDFIAVFGTKHMVTIAEGSKDKIPLMYLIPMKDRNLGIGTGDMAMPLTFTVSVFRDYGAGYAIPTAIGGLLGLVWLFFYIQGRDKVVLPALPPITVGLLFGFGLIYTTMNLLF